MRKQSAVVAILVTLCLAAGCSSGRPESGPVPSPSVVSPSPSVGAEEQRAADFAAAEKAYRTFRKEYRRVLASGGADDPTRVMSMTASGPYLENFVEVVRSAKQLHAVPTGNEQVAYVRAVAYSQSAVTLKVCEDGSEIHVTADGEDYGDEGIIQATVRVRRVDSLWKVWSADAKEVTSCVE